MPAKPEEVVRAQDEVTLPSVRPTFYPIRVGFFAPGEKYPHPLIALDMHVANGVNRVVLGHDEMDALISEYKKRRVR